MTTEEGSAPGGIDVSKPSTARMYDYYLGGKDNFAIDRDAAEKALTVFPDGRTTILANRGFLVGATRTIAEAGVDQFIDVGTGIPTSPNVHEVAQATNPESRVVYVDNDPIVTAHSRALRVDNRNIGVVEHDVRDPQTIIDDRQLDELIDWGKPVGVLMIAVLHFVANENPEAIVAAFTERMVPGSYLALSVATTEGLTEQEHHDLRNIYAGSTATGADLMPATRITSLFDGFDILEPGVGPASWWCDDATLADSKLQIYAGVARKRPDS